MGAAKKEDLKSDMKTKLKNLAMKSKKQKITSVKIIIMVQLGRVTKQRHTLMNTAQLVVGLSTPQQQEDLCHWRNMKIRRKRVKKWKISTKANTLGRKRAIRKGGCSGATPLEHVMK